MKQKNNGGYSLIEVLVAISILGIIVSPVCANLLMSLRATEKTDEILQAQLAVSSAVETLMAEGIPWEEHVNCNPTGCTLLEHAYYDCGEANEAGVYQNAGILGNRFKNVTVETWHERAEDLYYKVEVTSELEPAVSVTTYIHAVEVEFDIEDSTTVPTTPSIGG